MRNLHPIVRLIASLVFGLSVLAFFALVSAEMATHHIQGVAERAVRQAFNDDGSGTRDGVRYEVVCGNADIDHEPSSECDPIAVKAERSLRSVSCSGRSLLRLGGKRWSCVAKFTDRTRLSIRVSLGYGYRGLELALPFSEPDAR